MDKKNAMILWFEQVNKKDVPLVGGKNASLGEMISRTSVPVPEGFAITANAYRYFIKYNNLERTIHQIISSHNLKNVKELEEAGKAVRDAIKKAKFPKELEQMIIENYRKLGKRIGRPNPLVAVRSSATAEDLPDASFAGQQETYLNVKSPKQLIEKVKECFASLFTDRAISYREDKGFGQFSVALSVAVERMVESKASGIMFTLDPDTGFRNVVYINASYGLGEVIVQGEVNPDEFHVLKPTMTIISRSIGTKDKMMVLSHGRNVIRKVPKSLANRQCISDEEVLKLAEYGLRIEKHYGRPMDIEWAKDHAGRLYIVQARPETVHSSKKQELLSRYKLEEKSRVLVSGQAIGRKIGQGVVKIIKSPKEIGKFRKGDVLVTRMTDPDWEPIMKMASAIVTDEGGRLCHAAIVSRELGIPAVVGTGNATIALKTGQKVTVDCTGEKGKVWEGMLKFSKKDIDTSKLPKTKTKVLVNVGIPEEAFEIAQLPVGGVGLAREEFIINSYIGEHPMAMIKQGRSQEYIDKLAEGIAKIAAAFYPREVILRFSDFKTNEYANLKNGKAYEPEEDNPMLGWRGASRYIDPGFEPAFRLELRAVKKVREEMKLDNLVVMIPFCRTTDEAKKILKIMKSEGLAKGKKGLKVYVMAEIPANIVLADKFSEIFDGFSIGSNDLTQLTLGVDRDSAKLSAYDERNPAVKKMIEMLIKTAHKYKRKVGICGQAPSDYPEYVDFLVKLGIDTISVNPDVAVDTILRVARAEKKLKKGRK